MNDMLAQRISQWEKMTSDDPGNAMGWMSLGNAYKEGEEFEKSAYALKKAIEIDQTLSRAYQVLGQVLIKAEENDSAAFYLSHGYVIAAQQGDVMPMKAMGSLLEKIGEEIPQVKKANAEPVNLTGEQVLDRKTNKPGNKLPDAPMRGPVGEFILAHYSTETWREWIDMGTKVINELRLDFSNVEHQASYDVHMKEWLGFTDEDVDAWKAEQA